MQPIRWFLLALTAISIACWSPSGAAAGFTAAASMQHTRDTATATLLPSGNVLVAGGVDSPSNTFRASVEIYNTATGAWTGTAPLARMRFAHTATLLPSGKVLVVGGYDGMAGLASAELFDPPTGAWTSAAAMATRRSYHTATLLVSGKVLVAGGVTQGRTGDTTATAELYDPAVDAWTTAGPLAAVRSNHTATLLPSGKVLAVGGIDAVRDVDVETAELYDPATNAWTAAGALMLAREAHTATLLPSGKVLVGGGFNIVQQLDLASVELYDPVTNTWTRAAPLATARSLHTATLLSSGQVLVAGGFNENDAPTDVSAAELYDPVADAWTAAGALVITRDTHVAVRLASGRVLLAGGAKRGALGDVLSSLASAELYDPPPAVVEFYNGLLDNFFITASLPEQTAIAGGGAGPGWTVTGGAFKPGGPAQVCRFYGSLSPGPNSHFYTIDPAECQSLKDIQAQTPATQKRWNFESLDFASTVPVGGQCPPGTKPVYRAYNNGFARGVDSNHRLTADLAAYQAQIAKGWLGEGVVMCAPV